MKTIEHRIVAASVSDGHILTLHFDEGSVLEFRDVWGTYEFCHSRGKAVQDLTKRIDAASRR